MNSVKYFPIICLSVCIPVCLSGITLFKFAGNLIVSNPWLINFESAIDKTMKYPFSVLISYRIVFHNFLRDLGTIRDIEIEIVLSCYFLNDNLRI